MNRSAIIASRVLLGACLSTFSAHASDLSGSVGVDGDNRGRDVRLVQKRLNQVPPPAGGPRERLAEDGMMGPLTSAAIKRFQRIQLGIEDGRVDVGGRTDRRLQRFENFTNQNRPGPAIAWGRQVTGDFKKKVLQISRALSIDPNFLMAAMAFETGESFSPAIKNAAGSGATGLIQFMPSTARGLGTTTEQLSRLSAVEQLDYVQRYFRPYRGRCHTLSDVYMAILWPRAIGKPENYVLFDAQRNPTTYRQNRGLDVDGDGNITKAESASKVQVKLVQGLLPKNRG